MIDLLNMVLIKTTIRPSFGTDVEVEYLSIKELSQVEVSLIHCGPTESTDVVSYRLNIETKSECFLIYEETVTFHAGGTKLSQLALELERVLETQLESLWKAAYRCALSFEKDPDQPLFINAVDYVGLEKAVKACGKKIFVPTPIEESDDTSELNWVDSAKKKMSLIERLRQGNKY